MNDHWIESQNCTQVANALYNKGVRLGVLEQFEEAIVVYDEVVARYGDDPTPELLKVVEMARDRGGGN